MKARLLIAVAALMCVPAATATAAELKLSETPTSGFPQRSYLLTLPDKRALESGDVTVTENGEPVSDVVIRAGGRSGTVLAIDTSESMHGRAIEDAMAAAREFAARRKPEQPLGVVFFSREPHVALEPTTDGETIDRVLAAPPTLRKGTRIHDAVGAAIDLVQRANVDTSSVVVLSDGADVGSVTPASEVLGAAVDARVRVFAVGLRSSASFDSTALRAVSQTGEYTEARASTDLAGVFADLGERLANEYVLSYQSPSPLNSRIAVAVEIKGVPGSATVAYESPAFPVGAGVPRSQESVWRSTAVSVGVAALVSVLLGLALLLVVRPVPKTVTQRIADFAPDRNDGFLARIREVSAVPMLAAADRWLERFRPWADFKLDVEIAKVRLSAIRILVATLALTLLCIAGLGILLDNVVMAIVVLVGLPVSVRGIISFKAGKVRRRFEDQLPANLQVLASALRAGHSFLGALNLMVADAPEPSKTEYRRVISDEQLGVPVEDSLKVVSERMRCEDVVYIGLIATLQQETGGNTAEVLDKVVETMRERAKIRRLVRTLTVQGRLGGWIVTALPIAMVVFLNFASPGYLDPMTEKPIGVAALVVAALMVAVGAHAIRRIVDIKV